MSAYNLFEYTVVRGTFFVVYTKENMRIGGIFVLFRRQNQKRLDMADVNVYTAARLGDMASSVSRLAQSFSEEIDGRHLTREDGAAAMQTAAAMVCGGCTRCNLYQDSSREDSYYLYYLLRAFEVHGSVRMEDMPLLFRQTCFHKEKYLSQLNSSLGRATMNLSWKSRFLESRDAVIVQFRELAAIIEEFSRQMEQAVDITAEREFAVKKIFRRRHMLIKNMLVLEYENKLPYGQRSGKYPWTGHGKAALESGQGQPGYCNAPDVNPAVYRRRKISHALRHCPHAKGGGRCFRG